jgi:hypothetical protein
VWDPEGVYQRSCGALCSGGVDRGDAGAHVSGRTATAAVEPAETLSELPVLIWLLVGTEARIGW